MCSDGNTGACDDGYYQKGILNAASRFTRGTGTSSGTVLDNATGLTWTRCNLNEYGSNCDQIPAVNGIHVFKWQSAVDYCESLVYCKDGESAMSGDCSGSGGILLSDWRLPNVKELQSIVDYGKTYDTINLSPSIDTTYFPTTKTSDPYWTATTDPVFTANAYYINFGGGEVRNKPNGVKTNFDYYVHCVRP
jgi:hypothetical protein